VSGTAFAGVKEQESSMSASSTANSRDPGGPVGPLADEGATRSNATRPVVKGEVAPRPPHERDESPDSGAGQPSEFMKQAASDLEEGQRDEKRGPETQRHYSELTQKDLTR
jgi:hypothetical protein